MSLLSLLFFLLLISTSLSFQQYNFISSSTIRLISSACTSTELLAVSIDTGTKNSCTNDEQLLQFTQLISDVDDTLKSSGGVNIAGISLGGIDVQYERGDFYPGVAQFMLELSRYGLPKSSKNCPAKIAILTARAEEFKIALEIKDSSKLAVALRTAGEDAGIEGWGVGPVFYGSVLEWVIQFRKGLRKFTNFERLIQQDPTGMIFQYIYVGDVGELDQEAGETMLREYPELVKAVFLHVVTDQVDVSPIIIPAPKFINGRPVVFFRTYIGAAVDAVQLGLMDLDGLTSVINAAIGKLSNVPETSDKWEDIRNDISRADTLCYT